MEALIIRPATTSHAGMSAHNRERTGITDDLVRASSGTEASEDLITDFDQTLAKI
ncbi:MAG: PLP-dependent aspartate aminotransferase family protein [Actinomycetota bacterium]|nr:PLP-dependent aspartate aminotransferase family protein [Actinomycetota bacterium]